MKKLLAVIIILCAVGVSASAADIKFTPEGGGKWIYCNNNEGIRNRDLMNSDSDPATYIMNNENLEPDLYDFLICHINGTDTDGGKGKGYNIELDMEITAVEDSEVTINKAFFDTPYDEAFIYGDGKWEKASHKFSCLQGLASYLGVNLCELNGSWMYGAKPYEPVTLNLKQGETVWLSEFMEDYTTVGFGKPVQIMGELLLKSGKINFNVAAFKAGDNLGDRTGFNPDAAFGKYAYCRTQKGIADSLPKVNTYLEYTIDDTVKDGDYIRNTVYNQYQPKGYNTEVWCSHLNPQDDIWSKNIAVESDLLTMKYKDDFKLQHYGANIPEEEKDNVWIWDAYHSDTPAYQGSVTGYDKENYIPNYPLSVSRKNEGYACNLGNYGVIESYNLKVKNTTDKDKYFEYVAETISSIAAYVEDEDGVHSGFLKGTKSKAEKDTMASVLIPAGGEKEFSVNVVLPINYVGGIRNYFQICDETHIKRTYEDYLNDPRTEKGPVVAGILAEEVKHLLSDEVKEIINGDYDCYELIKTDTEYMMRWIEWDGAPYYYYKPHWELVKTIYYLDDNYNITGKYDFDAIPQLGLFYDGYFYIEDADGRRYKSNDGYNWESYTKRMPLPAVKFNNDTPSDWADGEVRLAYTLDVVPYSMKDVLIYADNTTRETFCDILAHMLLLKDKMPSEISAGFSDTENKNVLLLGSAGIISGYEDGSFRPLNAITREEAATLLYKAAQYMGCENMEDQSYVYADNESIGDWAKEAVYRMYAAQIMTGMGEDMFAPKNGYTNEQSIATILRLYEVQ